MAYNKINPKHIRKNSLQVYHEARGEKIIGSAEYLLRVQIRLYNQEGPYRVESRDSSDCFKIFGMKDVFAVRDMVFSGVIERNFWTMSKQYPEWRTDIETKDLVFEEKCNLPAFLPGEKNPKHYNRKVKQMRRHEIQIQRYRLSAEKTANGKWSYSWVYDKPVMETDSPASYTFAVIGIPPTSKVTHLLLDILNEDSGFDCHVLRKPRKKRKSATK